MSVLIASPDLKKMAQIFDAFPETAETAMVLAINQVAERDGMAIMQKDMQQQIDFPAGYLKSRMTVKRRATKGSMEALISGRDRATSLARFAAGQTPKNTRGRGVRVQLRGGQVRHLRSSFLVNLKNGNTGLAVRLKPGESLRNSDSAVKLANNLYLLYGPSVDQVFRGVAEYRAPEIGEMVSQQFFRQLIRLSK